MIQFVDQVTLQLRAGNGGDGCVSIKREKFKPLAGPDGADGGARRPRRGGHAARGGRAVRVRPAARRLGALLGREPLRRGGPRADGRAGDHAV